MGIVAIPLLIVYIVVAIIVTKLFSTYVAMFWGKDKEKTRKRAKIASIAFFVLLPTWDTIVASIGMYGLCVSQGGVHVFEQRSVDSQYFDEQGIPRVPKADNKPSHFCFGEQCFDYVWEKHVLFSLVTGTELQRDSLYLVDPNSNQRLGEFRRFLVWPWYAEIASSCPNLDQKGLNHLFASVFNKGQ